MARELAASLPGIGSEHVGAELLRRLAEGVPVAVESLAAVLGRPASEVASALQRLPNVEFDPDGRVVGCGITLRPTPHRLVVDGRTLFTWCAFDTLLYPPMLGRPAAVESRCAASGDLIRLTVTATGVEGLVPGGAVMSLVVPDRAAACCDVRGSFCDRVHFFRAAEAAGRWLEENARGVVLPVAEAFDLGRRVREHCQRAVL